MKAKSHTLAVGSEGIQPRFLLNQWPDDPGEEGGLNEQHTNPHPALSSGCSLSPYRNSRRQPGSEEAWIAAQEALRRCLRNITLYDEAKSDRLIDFERDELKRKGRPEETVEGLMERAIGRWERENAAAVYIY